MADKLFLRAVPTANPHIANLDATYGSVTQTIAQLQVTHVMTRDMTSCRSNISMHLCTTKFDRTSEDIRSINDARSYNIVSARWIIAFDGVDYYMSSLPKMPILLEMITKKCADILNVADRFEYFGRDVAFTSEEGAQSIWVWLEKSLSMFVHQNKLYGHECCEVNLCDSEDECNSSDKCEGDGENNPDERVLKFGVSHIHDTMYGFLFMDNPESPAYAPNDFGEYCNLPELYEHNNALVITIDIRTAHVIDEKVIIAIIKAYLDSEDGPVWHIEYYPNGKSPIDVQIAEMFADHIAGIASGHIYGEVMEDTIRRVIPKGIKVDKDLESQFHTWLYNQSSAAATLQAIRAAQNTNPPIRPNY